MEPHFINVFSNFKRHYLFSYILGDPFQSFGGEVGDFVVYGLQVYSVHMTINIDITLQVQLTLALNFQDY